jgi:hypothetical protein
MGSLSLLGNVFRVCLRSYNYLLEFGRLNRRRWDSGEVVEVMRIGNRLTKRLCTKA